MLEKEREAQMIFYQVKTKILLTCLLDHYCLDAALMSDTGPWEEQRFTLASDGFYFFPI